MSFSISSSRRGHRPKQYVMLGTKFMSVCVIIVKWLHLYIEDNSEKSKLIALEFMSVYLCVCCENI